MRFRKLKQQTKQKKEPKKNIHYASYPDRIKALITDIFMIYAPILYLIAYVILGSKEAFQSSQAAQFSGVFLYGLIYALLLWKFGQTPGKKAYDIKVVDDRTLKSISFVRAFARFVAFLFSATIVVGLLTHFYRKDKKALHDILCHTIEIKIEE